MASHGNDIILTSTVALRESYACARGLDRGYQKTTEVYLILLDGIHNCPMGKFGSLSLSRLFDISSPSILGEFYAGCANLNEFVVFTAMLRICADNLGSQSL